MRAHRVLVILVLVITMLLSSTMLTGAITNGAPDGDNHPYVVMIVFYNEARVPQWRCSGSLIAPNLVLTAGHCTQADEGGNMPFAQVWEESDMAGTGYYTSGGTWGTPYTNPAFCHMCYGPSQGLPAYSFRDNGVVVLDEPIVVSRYAQLPAPGLVDTLKNKTSVDLVGYGVQEKLMGGGPPVWTGLKVRMYAPAETVSGKFIHSGEYLRLTANPGGGSGGTCFGDSGGPSLLGGTDTVLAVTSYGTNGNCAGVDYSARVDIPEVLAWVTSFMQ